MSPIKYSYNSLINSKALSEDKWVASIALDPNKTYSLKEAKRIIDACKKIKRER